MESASSPNSAKEEQVKNVTVESLPPEKLVAKYRSLLSLAQKAKQAKDDAMNKNISLQEENAVLTKKLSGLENQLKTSQEMLAVLTDKKLNLTMELDDMKTVRARSLDEIKSLSSRCEKLEVEAESYKRQYNKLLNENELLLKKLEITEQKLEIDSNKALQLQNDIKKLHENNEHIKYLWANVSKDKLELEELLHNANNKLQILEKQKAAWHSYLSDKYRCSYVDDDTESWIMCLDKIISNALSANSLREDSDKNSDCNEINMMRISNANIVLLEKEAIESELNELREQNKKLKCELNAVNSERDKMDHNLESVRVETHQLIENSDKLSQEIEALKLEKREMEHEISSLIQKANLSSQELNGKLEQSHSELENLKIKNDSLNYSLKTYQEEVLHLNSKISEKEDNALKNLNELEMLKIKNSALAQEVEMYKINFSHVDAVVKVINSSENENIKLKDTSKSLSELNLTDSKEDPQPVEELIDESNLTAKLQHCESSLQEKIIENEHLNNILQTTKEKLSSLIILEEKLSLSDNHYTDISDIMNCLQEEIRVSQNIQEKYRIQVENLQQDIELMQTNYSSDIDQYENKLRDLENNNKQLLFDFEENKSKLCKKVEETEQLKSQLSDLENKNLSCNNELLALKSEIETLKTSSEHFKVIEKEMCDSIERNSNVILDKDSTIETLTEQINSYNLNLEEYKKKLSVFEERDEEMNLQDSKLRTKIQQLEDLLQDNTSKSQLLNGKINECSEELQQKTCLVDNLQKKICELESLNNDLTQNIRNLQCKNSALSQEFENTSQKDSLNITKIQEAYSLVSEELKKCQNTILNRNAEFEESNRLWNARLTVFKGGLIGLKQTNEELARHFFEIQTHFGVCLPDTMEKIIDSVTNFIETTMASSKHELLSEMQHMNQALKERGELISKLQENICESKGKSKKLVDENSDLLSQINQLKETLLSKEELLKNKDLLIKELETEVNKIKEVHETNTEGDVMSTSTISKTEEVSQLKDIEESFEEKYVKLKFLAMKLKKRLSESSQTLESERIKMASDRQEFVEKIHSLSTVAKTAQKVQESFDKTLDELEEEKKKTEVLQSLLESIQKSEETLKLKIANLEGDVKKLPVLRKQIESLELSLKDSKKEIMCLQKDKVEDSTKYEELKKETNTLESKLSEVNEALQLALQQGRVNNVLELEMQNYEKTIADLSSQLSSEKDLTKSLNNEIEAVKNLINGLEEQIKLLEGRISVEEERNTYISDQLSTSRLKNDNLQAELDKHILNIDSLTKELHCEKNKCETLVLECSTIGAEFKKREKDLHLQIDVLQSHVHNLETTLATTKQDLIASRNEVEHIKNDFESYRIRAQSVLAKQKGETITQGEKEAREQMELMNTEVTMLRQKLDTTLSELDTLKSESTLYLSEKERTDKRIEELSKIIQQKTQEIDCLSTEFRSYKISHETLIQCYKNELDEKETKHKTEISGLQKRIDELHFQIQQKEEINSEKELSYRKADVSLTPLSPVNDSDNLPLEREDGEGSESVPSPKTRRRSILVPLDILLNSPMNDESRVSVLNERIEKLQNELVSYEVRTRHLSSLLSEAEKDSARNAQLNSVLKEEVRRLERSLERQPHAQNTEYLKNIIIKFLTLQSCDERARLVPVLDTILKLSPEEKHQLKLAAKVDTASWGNYLPSWSGL